MFPNAAKGVKKIFSAEILALIGTVLVGIATTIYLAVGEKRLEENTALATVVLIGLLAGSALMLIGLIIKIIGVFQTSKDEPAFKGVFYVALFDIAVTIVASIFSKNNFLNSVANGVSTIAEVVTTVLIILGICHMADILGRKDMLQRGGKILRIVVWLAGLSILLRFISIFLPKNYDDANDFAKVIVLSLMTLSVILSIVEYVLYIIFLSKAKKMLNE